MYGHPSLTDERNWNAGKCRWARQGKQRILSRERVSLDLRTYVLSQSWPMNKTLVHHCDVLFHSVNAAPAVSHKLILIRFDGIVTDPRYILQRYDLTFSLRIIWRFLWVNCHHKRTCSNSKAQNERRSHIAKTRQTKKNCGQNWARGAQWRHLTWQAEQNRL